MQPEDLSDLPGGQLVQQGIADAACGKRTSEALLVAIAAPSLRQLGLSVSAQPRDGDSPEHALYAHLAAQSAVDAHAAFNALRRRLVSFQHAMEARIGRQLRRSDAR